MKKAPTRIHNVDIVKRNAVQHRDDEVLTRMPVQVRELQLGHFPAECHSMTLLDLLCGLRDDLGCEKRESAESLLMTPRSADPNLTRIGQLVERLVEGVWLWCAHFPGSWSVARCRIFFGCLVLQQEQQNERVICTEYDHAVWRFEKVENANKLVDNRTMDGGCTSLHAFTAQAVVVKLSRDLIRAFYTAFTHRPLTLFVHSAVDTWRKLASPDEEALPFDGVPNLLNCRPQPARVKSMMQMLWGSAASRSSLSRVWGTGTSVTRERRFNACKLQDSLKYSREVGSLLALGSLALATFAATVRKWSGQ